MKKRFSEEQIIGSLLHLLHLFWHFVLWLAPQPSA